MADRPKNYHQGDKKHSQRPRDQSHQVDGREASENTRRLPDQPKIWLGVTANHYFTPYRDWFFPE